MNIGRRKISPLFHFTSSYLLIVLIPLVMGLFHFWYVVDMATQQTVYANTLILKNSMDSLENNLKSIFTYSQTLNQIKIMDDIITADKRENIDILQLQSAAAAYPLLLDDRRYLDIYFLYSSRNGIILAPSKAFLNVEIYYGYYFDFDDMSFEQWSRQILHNPDKPNGVFLFPTTDGGGKLIYQMPYISHKDGKVAGQQVYLLDEDRIKNALYPAFQIGAGFMYIEDNKGNLLVTMEREDWLARSLGAFEGGSEGVMERDVDGERMIVTYCKSADYGWTYVIAVPKSVLTSTAMKSLKMAFITTTAMALVGIIMIMCAYKYNRRPLENMVRYMHPAENPIDIPLGKRIQNGLWQLSGSITSLVRDKSLMEEQIEQQREALMQSFLVQLITGHVLDEASIPQLLHNYGINANCDHIRGAYLKIQSREVPEEAKKIIEDIIGKSHSLVELIPCVWMDERHLTLLCVEQQGATAGICMDLLRDIHFRLMEWGLEITFSLGGECGAFSEVHQSFSDAKKLLLSSRDAVTILRSSELNSLNRDKFQYSAREEEALLDLAATGRLNETRALIEKIKHKNFIERKLNPDMREALFCRMATTLLCSDCETDMPRMDFYSFETEEFFDLLLNQYETVCQWNIRRMHESQEKMNDNIVRYIDENYHDSNMGLGMLSQRFGVTESYLSTLIKNLVGKNFSHYLETKRIEEANQLLRSGGKTVTEIGRHVGYDSATSFGRAYKRVMGYSPSQYLKRDVFPPPNA